MPVPAVEGDRPEWLPEDWKIELRKRSNSCLRKKRLDRYYICPSSGKKYRSRLEVMRLLNNEMPHRSAMSSPLTVVGKRRMSSSLTVVGEQQMSLSLTVVGKRPDWLPEGWSVEFKERRDLSRIDKYYICPATGTKYRSKLEVMRLLNNEMPDRLAVSTLTVVGERPEWLPEGWAVEFRKRRASNCIDKYYICPFSGKKLRSKVEVMRFLDNEMLDCSASGSAPLHDTYKPLAKFEHSPNGLPEGWSKETRMRKDGRTDTYYIDPVHGFEFRSKKDVFRHLEHKDVCQTAFRRKRIHTLEAFSLKEEFLPIIAYKKSKVKQTVARRRLFTREGPESTLSTEIEFRKPLQTASSSFGHTSAELNARSLELSCPTSGYPQDLEERLLIEWHPDLNSCGESQLVPRAKPSGQNHLEITKKRSPSESHSFRKDLQELCAAKTLPGSREDMLSTPLIELVRKRHRVPTSNLSGELALPLAQFVGERLPVQDSSLLGEKSLLLTKLQGQSKRHKTGGLFQCQSAIKMLPERGNEKLLEGGRLSVPDANPSEEKQIELSEKQTQGEKLRGKLSIEVVEETGNELLLQPLIQVEGEKLRVQDATLLEEKLVMPTEKLSRPEKNSIEQKLHRGSSIKFLPEPCEEKLAEWFLPVEGSNLSEEKQCEMAEKNQRYADGCQVGAEFQESSALKVPLGLENEKLSFMHLESGGLPVSNVILSDKHQVEPPVKQIELKKCSGGEELRGKSLFGILTLGNKLSLLQQKDERVFSSDGNLSEDKQIQFIQKQSQPIMIRFEKEQGNSGDRLPNMDAGGSRNRHFELTYKRSQRRFPGVRGKVGVKSKIKTVPDPVSKKLECKTLPALDSSSSGPANELSLVQREDDRLPIIGTNGPQDFCFELTDNQSQLDLSSISGEFRSKSDIKMVQDSEKPQLECQIQPVRDSISFEENQPESAEKKSQPKRHGRRCSKNTEAITSGNNQPHLRKRKDAKADTVPVCASKRLAGAKSNQGSNNGTGRQARGAKARRTDHAQPTMRKGSNGTSGLQEEMTISDGLQDPKEDRLPVRSAKADLLPNSGTGRQTGRAKAKQADHAQPTMPKETDATFGLQEELTIADELKEKLKRLKPFVEQQTGEPQPILLNGCSRQKEMPISKELQEKLERQRPSTEKDSYKQQATQVQHFTQRCCPHQNNTCEADELKEKLKRLVLNEDGASQNQPVDSQAPPLFGDPSLDPCIEFAVKTLTSDFPVLGGIADIEDFFSHQLNPSKSQNKSQNLSGKPIPLALGSKVSWLREKETASSANRKGRRLTIVESSAINFSTHL